MHFRRHDRVTVAVSLRVICVAGELIGVEYLYSQTGQVLRMNLPEPDEAVEEEQLIDEMSLDEGFVDVSVDVEDLTVSVADDAELGPTQTVAISTTELPQPSATLSASSVSMNNNSA